MTEPSTGPDELVHANRGPSRATRPRDPWVVLGLTISALSAAVSSFSGLRELAVVAGWSNVLAPLLPLCIDSLAMTSVRVWVSAATRSERARRFARRTAVGAVLLSLTGNAVYHVIAAGLLEVSWMVVLSVGAVPALVLGLVSHLAVVRTQEDESGDTRAVEPPLHPGRTTGAPSPGAGSGTGQGRRPASSRTGPAGKTSTRRPRYGSEDELLAAAREALETSQAAHQGRIMSRDELRRVLGISTGRASAVMRALRAEAGGPRA